MSEKVSDKGSEKMSETNYTVFDDLDEEDDAFVEESGELIPSENNESYHYDPVMMTPSYHVKQGERALEKLKFVVEESGWKKSLSIRNTTVYSKSGVDDDKVPIFMCDHIIENFTPQSIFAVVGMRKLWDPWYEEGNLVENLDETTSLTYMVMQGVAGTKTRDLSLVEKIQCTPDGTIYFATTSVETNKVPRVVDKIRASLHLNGWIIKPVSTSPPIKTKVTYVLQTKVNGWIPSVVAKKYLLKRPLVVHVIDQYLQKNGPPPVVVSTTPPSPSSNHPSRTSRTSRSSSVTSSSYPQINVNGTRNHIDLSDHSRNRSKSKKRNEKQSTTSDTSLSNENQTVQNSTREISIDLTEDTQSPHISLEDLDQFPAPSTSTKQIQLSSTSDQSNQNQSIDSIQVQPESPVQPIMKHLTVPPPPSPPPPQPLSPPLPIRHRYTDVVNKAIEIFKDNVETLNGWNFYTENKGVKIYIKDTTGRSTPIIRGDYTINGSFTSDDFLSVIKNLDLRKLWDERYEDGDSVEIFDSDNILSKVSMKGIFPVSGRDFALCGTVEHDSESSKILFVTTSITDPAIPEVKKYVRGHVNFTGWQIEPKFDLNGITKSLKIIYIVDTELKLDLVPQSIIKTISTGTPLVLQKIDEMMQKIGFPPYIIGLPTKIITEKIDPKTFQYDCSFIPNNNTVKEIRFSRKMYPNGLDISIIPNNIKVELLSYNTEIIRITFPSGMDKIQVKIIKYKSGFKMTYNGHNKIPLVQNQISTRAVLPIEKETKETVLQSQNKRRSRKLSISIEPNISLVDNRDKRDSVPRKQKRLSFADQPSFINPESSFTPKEDNKTSELEAIPAENEGREVREGHEEQEEREELEEREEFERDERFIVNPIENYTLNINKDIITISDDVKFNTYQAAIMFAGMILSYYSGKLSCYLLH